MRARVLGSLTLVALLAIGATVIATAGEKTWVSSSGENYQLRTANAAFSAEDGETFDLSDLADGETRTFGSGDKQIVASRSGDVVTITSQDGEGKGIDIECTISEDTCKIVTLDGGDENRTMVMIKKSSTCIGDAGECEIDVSAFGHGEGMHSIILREDIECEEGEDCLIQLESRGGLPHPEGMIMMHSGDAHAEGMMEMLIMSPEHGKMQLHSEGAVLRCPEGDSTLRVKKEEAEEVFLCPKHSVPMEKLDPEKFIRKLRFLGEPHQHHDVEDDKD